MPCTTDSTWSGEFPYPMLNVMFRRRLVRRDQFVTLAFMTVLFGTVTSDWSSARMRELRKPMFSTVPATSPNTT